MVQHDLSIKVTSRALYRYHSSEVSKDCQKHRWYIAVCFWDILQTVNISVKLVYSHCDYAVVYASCNS